MQMALQSFQGKPVGWGCPQPLAQGRTVIQ